MFARFFSNNPARLYLFQCLLFLAVLVLAFACASPFFLSASNIGNILTASAVIGLMALGATFVIGSGGIDLSSASVMALSGTLCAWTLQKISAPPALAVLVGLGAGTACGFLTGWLINVTRAPSFIVTLGIMSVVRAAAYIISDGMPIYGLPENVTAAGQGDILGIPAPILLLCAAAVLAYVILTQTRFGLHSLLAGDSVFAAHAAGISLSRLRLKIYTLAGFFSGLAGLVFMTRTNSGDPSAGMGYELIAITAVILGGANLFGGRASILGTVLGFLCLGVLQNGLNLLAVSTYYQILFVGVVLLAAAFLSRAENRL
ncbi:MAG: ABC transporter permease [Alphaproteobacteria bacterium]|nr:ABC transporter permease [Alphaproteobacteria bacterium]